MILTVKRAVMDILLLRLGLVLMVIYGLEETLQILQILEIFKQDLEEKLQQLI